MERIVILRILGVMVGLLLILSGTYMLFAQNNHFLSSASSLFAGVLFVVYGIGGNDAVTKILPGLGKYKNGN